MHAVVHLEPFRASHVSGVDLGMAMLVCPFTALVQT